MATGALHERCPAQLIMFGKGRQTRSRETIHESHDIEPRHLEWDFKRDFVAHYEWSRSDEGVNRRCANHYDLAISQILAR